MNKFHSPRRLAAPAGLDREPMQAPAERPPMIGKPADAAGKSFRIE